MIGIRVIRDIRGIRAIRRFLVSQFLNFSISLVEPFYFFAKKRSTRSGESICQRDATVQPGAKISL